MSRSENLREYWSYADLGFDCIVSQKTNRILSIFFSPTSPLATEIAQPLPFGCTEDQIKTQFHAPENEGGGIQMTDGTFIGRWFSYDSGIGFHFNQDGRVEKVSVFARKRKPHIKSAASVQEPSTRRIAAMRFA
jgi:hypothetical protein